MPLCHLSDRKVVRLSGPDTAALLQGLLTNDVTLLSAGQPLYAGLLSPQGKALFDLFLFAEGEDILLDVDGDRAESLVKRLLMFRLRRKVAISLDPDVAVFQHWGDGENSPGNDPRLAAAGDRFTASGNWPTPDSSLDDWHSVRLALGLPASDEIGSDDLLWLETNARELNGVSFTKGCYTGQENTARMHHRDKLRKRLLPLVTTADGPVMAGQREVGTLRGQQHGPWHMALLRTDVLDQPLTVGGQPATVVRPPWLPAEGSGDQQAVSP